ncbi:c-type cytochrome, partial [Klebsiella michiganensis]|uniref:c-type cytochrome n=1 Tax=Klebsiella michiganensis TaxID=1134687 RepID=UPI0019536022
DDKLLLAGLFIVGLLAAPALAFDFGRPATPGEITLWDIDVGPDGKGLPDGSGTAAKGKQIFADNCAACHGENGQGGIKDRL